MKRLREIFMADAASRIQRAFRRYLATCAAEVLRYQGAARDVQRVFRGHMGRLYASAVRSRKSRLERQTKAAVRIQACWKRHRVMQGYREIQVLRIGAVTIQRTWRGYLDRRFVTDLREWESKESGPGRLAVGVRIMQRESAALVQFQRDSTESARAHARCINRAAHAKRRLRRVNAELRRIRATKLGHEREAAKLDEVSRDRNALEAALKGMEEASTAGNHERRPRIDLKLLQQLAGMHGVRMPGGLGAETKAEAATSSDGESDDSAARRRRNMRARRKRQRAKAAMAEADQRERMHLAQRVQARAEERENTMLAVRLRRAEIGRAVLEDERRERALAEHADSLSQAAAALERQAEALTARRRKRQRELSHIVDRITMLADRQTKEFNAIQDRTRSQRQAEVMKRIAELSDQAQRAVKAEAERRADAFAGDAERALTSFIQPAAAAFLSSVTTIGAIEDGTVASHARALEFLTGGAAVRATSMASPAQLGGLTNAQAAVAGTDAAMVALGFQPPPLEDREGRQSRRRQLLLAATTATRVSDAKEAAAASGVSAPGADGALPAIMDRAVSSSQRPSMQLVPLSGSASAAGQSSAIQPHRRRRRRYRPKYQFGADPSTSMVESSVGTTQASRSSAGGGRGWSDEDSEQDDGLSKDEASVARGRRERDAARRQQWLRTRERRSGAVVGAGARARKAAEEAARRGDSADSDEDFVAGVVVDELEDERQEAERLAKEAGGSVPDAMAPRAQAMRRALAIGATTKLDLAASTGLTHQERTRDIDYSFGKGAVRTKRPPKRSASRFLPTSLRQFTVPDLAAIQLRKVEEDRAAALLAEAEASRERKALRRIRKLADSDDDSEDTDDGRDLSEKRGGSLAAAIENARAEAFGAELPADVRKWTVKHVGKWLNGIGFGQYAANAAEAELDGIALLEMSPVDMRDVVGIDNPKHLQRVSAFRQRLAEPPPTYVRPGGDLKRWRMGRYAGDPVKPWVPEEAGRAERGPELSDGRPLRPETVLAQAKLGRYGRVEEALAAGLPPDVLTGDGLGRAGLHMAALRCDRRMAAVFLRYGADVNAKDRFGNTPLHYAQALEPDGDMVAFLLDRGADDRARNNLGSLPEDRRLGPGADAGAILVPAHLRKQADKAP